MCEAIPSALAILARGPNVQVGAIGELAKGSALSRAQHELHIMNCGMFRWWWMNLPSLHGQ